MLKITLTTQFKKDYKRIVRRGYDANRLEIVMAILASNRKLPEKYRDHRLTNSRDFKDARECHILPDWLLVYRIHDDTLILELMRTGSHADIFGK